jgi:hypothetical protein
MSLPPAEDRRVPHGQRRRLRRSGMSTKTKIGLRWRFAPFGCSWAHEAPGERGFALCLPLSVPLWRGGRADAKRR